MEIRKYGNKKILIADEGKHIRSIDDIKRTDENGNIIDSYYSSIIFLANNFDESRLNDLYIEETIEENENNETNRYN